MDPRVTEFQCIMPLKNILSVLQHGILSRERAARPLFTQMKNIQKQSRTLGTPLPTLVSGELSVAAAATIKRHLQVQAEGR